MTHKARRWTLIALVAGGAAGVIVVASIGPFAPQPAPTKPAHPGQGAGASTQPMSADPALREAAQQQYAQAMMLQAQDKLIEARTLLSEAIFSEALPPDLAANARKAAQQLAELTIFSGTAREGDIYCDPYRIKPGDNLQKIELANQLHVPAELLERVNHIDPGKLMAGATIKLIRGPFHATVYKSQFVMDVYLQPEPLEGKATPPPIFIRRFGVGLGKNGSTPLGVWHVRLGHAAVAATQGQATQPSISGKLRHARFDPPPNCEIDHSIMYGEPGYPFGAKGLFIPLEGDDENTSEMTNYGIHSTDNPDSIGRDGSLGCIRLRDDDIELVFSLLYEKWSTVQTRQ